MRNVIFPLAFALVSTSLVACSFEMRAGSGTKTPASNKAANTAPSASAPATSATPTTPQATTPIKHLGKRPTPTPSTTTTEPTTTPTTPAPAGAAVVSAATPFGSGTVDPTGFKGNIYWVDKNTTQIPPLASMTPAGYLFTKELNVAPQAFTGFPGVDAARREYFAIRYEAPLIVTAEADYDFRVVSDDGAILLIDNTPIVDNDGARSGAAESTGPVHLVTGTHLLTVDYLQKSGNVALQVFCKKAGEAERICPTQL